MQYTVNNACDNARPCVFSTTSVNSRGRMWQADLTLDVHDMLPSGIDDEPQHVPQDGESIDDAYRTAWWPPRALEGQEIELPR